MKCPKCNSQIPDTALFCGNCGAELPKPARAKRQNSIVVYAAVGFFAVVLLLAAAYLLTLRGTDQTEDEARVAELSTENATSQSENTDPTLTVAAETTNLPLPPPTIKIENRAPTEETGSEGPIEPPQSAEASDGELDSESSKLDDATSTPVPKARIVGESEVYLGDLQLIDTDVDAPGCFGIGDISYSPMYDHFLVLLSCFEGDNEAFLFRANGSDKHQITGPLDMMNYSEHEWAPDGKSFTYLRINSCCLTEIPASAPPAGTVRYEIETGEKTWLAPMAPLLYRVVGVEQDDVLNVRSGPGVDNDIVGTIPPDGTGVEITGLRVSVGDSNWVPVAYEGTSGWVNNRFLTVQDGS